MVSPRVRYIIRLYDKSLRNDDRQYMLNMNTDPSIDNMLKVTIIIDIVSDISTKKKKFLFLKKYIIKLNNMQHNPCPILVYDPHFQLISIINI